MCCFLPLDLPLPKTERQTEETCHCRLSHLLTGAALFHHPGAPFGERPSRLLPVGARAWLLRDPALPGLILQGKQLSNHIGVGGPLYVWKVVLAFSAHSVRFLFLELLEKPIDSASRILTSFLLKQSRDQLSHTLP